MLSLKSKRDPGPKYKFIIFNINFIIILCFEFVFNFFDQRRNTLNMFNNFILSFWHNLFSFPKS